ncbi:MAG: hypothetical protein J3K34DRAFT_286300 [Monoraphidium minutum]|nr:MAG: hypothetical protein J3K34DRAFT_286300 [Monoraphidium minutum]
MPKASVTRQDSGSKRVTFAAAPGEPAPPLPGVAPPQNGDSQHQQQQQQQQQQSFPVVISSSSDEEEAGPLLGDAAADGPPPPSGWYARFKAAVRALKHEVLALYYAIHDPRTPWGAKVLPWVALAYALSPLDLIPDFIPILGFLDDMLLLPALLWVAVKLIPADIMADARERARTEPLRLHRNWGAATLVFLMWTGLFVLCAHLAFQRWADDDTLPYEWTALAGTAGVCTIAYVTWLVATLSYERRRRVEWSSALNAPLNPPDSDGSSV